ncbi:MAG: helix-turn-helix transcriptional regulator [Desulfitobacteriaceae bacterium]|nr:helix-turn-helix transcriptional regulator [Desulfitobacteriaceae bacterium]
MKTSNYLLEICKKHGITLTELGKRVGKSKQYMSELGQGNIPLKYEMAIKIATSLNTTPDELFLDVMSSEDGLQPTGTQD